MELPQVHYNDKKLHTYQTDNGLFLVIRLYDLKVMKILTQALILALLIIFLPRFGSNFDESSPSLNTKVESSGAADHPLNLNSLPLVLRDLGNQGLLTSIGKSLFVTNNILNNNNNNNMMIANVVISPSDIEKQSSIPDGAFDFAFTNFMGSEITEFVDRTLKVGGIMVVQLSRFNPPAALEVTSTNYKTVYMTRMDDTFIALRKVSSAKSHSPTQRKLLEFLSEEKKAVLKNLEDVLLEPPRSASGRSRTYLRKTKFLPDLLNDSLDGYSRRVYIDVGGGHGSTKWFEQNYPTRNKDFDMYRIETVPENEVESDDAWEGPPTQMGISDWLWRNVKSEEYVVMRAEAEVVEEMLKSKAIVLVDELFLDCKPNGKLGSKSKRAYWECLALYGRLRDFGVAVHQWWG